MKIKQLFLTSLVLGLFSLTLAVGPISAQEEASDSTKTTQNLRERIERIVEEKKEQIRGVINNLESQKQAFIGQVIRISEETITVKTNKATRILPINPQVELLKGTSIIKLSDVAVDNWLVVMGVLEDDDFRPIRILVSATDIRPKTYFIALGSVTELDKTTLTIKPRNAEEPVAITTNNKTIFEDLNGQVIARTDLEVESQLLVVASEAEGDKIAKRVRLLTVLASDNE